MKKSKVILLLILSCALFSACSKKPEKIEIISTDSQIFVGDNLIIQAVITPTDINVEKHPTKWISSNEDIATINDKGELSAIKSGAITITASIDEDTVDSCEISILDKPAITSISIEGNNELLLNDEEHYSLTITPNNYKEELISWTSSDENIATIDNGELTTVSTGTVTITATTENNISDTFEIQINPIPLEMSTGFSGSTSIAGNSYNMNISFSAQASGGTGTGYLYNFEIIQNGNTTKTTGWIEENSISANLNGLGSCEIKVSVKDSSGEILTQTKDLLSH